MEELLEDNQQWTDVEFNLAEVGNQMLQGASLRPIWLQVSHPRIRTILTSFANINDNCQVTPYF